MSSRHYVCVVAVALVAGCASDRVQGPGVDAEVRELAATAATAFQRGDVPRATELYGRALERARRVGDAQETARNAYNLALCRLASGDVDATHALLVQARGLLPARGKVTARTWLADAEAALRAGDPDGARRFATRALEVGADREGCAQARLVLASPGGSAPGPEETAQLLAQARKDLGRSDAPALHARIEGLAASLALASGDVPGAAGALERQARWLSAAGDYGAMAEVLLGAGTHYRAAGRPGDAYPCLMRAAASFKALRAKARAAAAASLAAEAAKEAVHPDWAAAAEALVAEIGRP